DISRFAALSAALFLKQFHKISCRNQLETKGGRHLATRIKLKKENKRSGSVLQKTSEPLNLLVLAPIRPRWMRDRWACKQGSHRQPSRACRHPSRNDWCR